MNLKLSYNNQCLQHRFWMVLILLIGIVFPFQYIGAQVRVPFTQRTSSYTPDTKIYNIKGDFQLIGNTNMTLVNYDNNGSNNESMEYIDVDDDSNTLNSSSATLTFSTEGGADPNCSNIIYAGLYWTGRAHNETSSNTFYVGSSVSTNNRNDEDSFNGYALSISSASNTSLGSNGTISTYTLTPSNGGNPVVFRFRSWSSESSYTGTVTVQVGSSLETSLSGSITSNTNNNFTFTLNTPYTINTGSQTIYINSLRKRRTDISINTNYSVSVTSGAKLLDKHKVKLKKAGGTYQTVTANVNDIYYPTNSDGYMYSAYAEVTDYVKANKAGEYFVADIALQEGSGGSTGFYGGWGLIVVYENSKMKWRDVTIFDGHAYVASKGGNQELSVSGFNTVQQGPVDIKLGLMAGEGDVSVTGDQFKIRNAANKAWINLSHGGNLTDNFFNSSIYTGGNARNPELKNNTGLDISMFTLNNDDKSIMKNNQTSTSFQYSSTQDTYIIFCIAMAVDAYIPEVQANNNIRYINNVVYNNGSSSTTVYPNDEIEYTLYIQNLGSEAVTDSKIVIPIPFTTSYMSASDEYLWKGNPDMSGTVTYNSSLGGTGSIIWDIGYIPLPTDKDEILAKLTYKLKVTDNCYILNNSSCITVSVDGSSSGTGVTSGVSFTNNKFVTDFIQDENCNGQPIYDPIKFNIDASSYLATNQCIIPEDEDPDYYTHRKFKYCGLSVNDTISLTDISLNFPKGSKFYSGISYDENGYVIPAENATYYTSGFPVGTFGKPTTYYAIPPGMNITCYWEFIITVDQFCGNYWHGSESTHWDTPNNWTAKKVPNTGEDIEFATAANNKNNPARLDLYLDTDRIIGNLINNSDMNMVVTIGNQLTINGIVKDENSSRGTIVVKSDSNSPTGTLLFTNPTANTSVKATVEFINKAYECDNCGFYKKQWQYFGIPLKKAEFPYLNKQVETVNQWVEPYPYSNKWRPAPCSPDITLKAFGGYEMTRAENVQPTYTYSFSGILNVGNAIVPVTNTLNVNYSGINLIGNSFTAAIPITSIAINIDSIQLNENTVYLFNMGTRDQWRKLNGGIANGIAAGQYQAVPFNLAGQAGIPDRILSMHTFMLNVAKPGNITLQYDQLVKNELNTYTQKPWKSAIRESKSTQLPHIIMDVIGNGSADRIWLFEHEETTTGFDSGWDGYKMTESDLIQAYVYGSDQSDYQIATVPNVEGTTIGVKTALNESFIMNLSVTSEVESRKLYLRDLLTKRNYPIINNAEYTISGSKSSVINRFKIMASSSDLIEDNSEEGLINIYVRNNIIFIENQSEEDCIANIYDLAGKLVNHKKIRKNEINEFEDIFQGKTEIYIIKVVGKNQIINKIDKVILK